MSIFRSRSIALIQLGAFGDCLMVTPVARQIKSDYPGCRLTWIIDKRYVSIIDNNPYVDEVRTFDDDISMRDCGIGVIRAIEAEHAKGVYDLVFNTLVYPFNVARFDGTSRPSMIHNYSSRLTVPVTSVLRLREAEIEHVKSFSERCHLQEYRHVVLMECTPTAGQSCMTLARGLRLAEQLVDAMADCAVIISTHIKFSSTRDRIFCAAEVTLRENAALARECTFLIGCSSGITWVTMSDAGRVLPTVQFLRRAYPPVFASISYDLAYWHLPVSHVIESTTDDPMRMFQIVMAALTNFPQARTVYHENLRPFFWGWFFFIDYRRGWRGILTFYRPLVHFVRRNGFHLMDVMNVADLVRVLSTAFKQFVLRH